MMMNLFKRLGVFALVALSALTSVATAQGLPISNLPAATALTGSEIVPIVTVGHVSAITQATFAVVTFSDTSAVNLFTTGQTVLFAGLGGMTQLNGQNAVISATGGTSGAWTITVPINSSSYSAFTSGGQATTTVNTTIAQLVRAVGVYQATFLSGPVQYSGPNGLITGDNNLIFGKSLPNPSGTPGPALLIGSGGGSGAAITASIIQDQAFDNITPGNNLIITAGETQPAGVAAGGSLTMIAGASFGGTGGPMQAQGGTSAHGPGGMAVLEGGNNTDGTEPPGDTFVVAGETGSQGANVHLIMTNVGGTCGDVRIRSNSTVLEQFLCHGEIYLTASGTGAGLAGQPLVSGGVGQPAKWLTTGYTGTITTAKLTTGGSNGSMTFASGILVSSTPAN